MEQAAVPIVSRRVGGKFLKRRLTQIVGVLQEAGR
jgi:hypothetical protein